MKNQVMNSIKILVVAIALSAGISYATNWVAPTGSPPGNNAEAPVNVGTVSQIKNGNLGLNNLAVFYNASIMGNASVGDFSTDPGTGTLKVATLQHTNSTDTYVCADQDGTFFLCGATPPPPTSYQCSDGVDNDGDGKVDFDGNGNLSNIDPGCYGAQDPDEYNAPPVYQCSDGTDNDGDSLIDYPADPGCVSSSDNSETNAAPQCSDGTDNDGDSLIDYPADYGCTGPSDNSEAGGTPPAQCNDGVDNDGDGDTDYPTDLGCASTSDTNEKINVTITYTKNSSNVYTLTGTPSNFQAICKNCAFINSPGPRFIPPLGLNQITVTAYGGGGGGGGASVDDNYYGTLYGPTNCLSGPTPCVRRGGGGGGGGGGMTTSTVTVAPQWLYTIGVGSAGVGGLEDVWYCPIGASVPCGAGSNGGDSFFNGNPSGAPYNAPAVNITVTGGKGGRGAFADGAMGGTGGLKGTGQNSTPTSGGNGYIKVTRSGVVQYLTTSTNGLDGGSGGITSGLGGSPGRGGSGGTALDVPSPVCNNANVCRGNNGYPGAVVITFDI